MIPERAARFTDSTVRRTTDRTDNDPGTGMGSPSGTDALSRDVLIVEDDTDLSEALSDGLGHLGYRVRTATDGEEALEMMGRHVPDLIVLDLMMPGMNGWSFRVAQRRNPVYAGVPVIAISASSSPMARAVDSDVFLQKPVDAQSIARAIESVLEGRGRIPGS